MKALAGFSVMGVAGTPALMTFSRKRMVDDTVEDTVGNTLKESAAKVLVHLYSRIIAHPQFESGSRRHGVWGPSGRAGRLGTAILLAIGAAVAGHSPAQDIPARYVSGGIVLEAEAAARRLGLVVSADGTSLTLRSPKGILTLFDGSPDVVWQPHGAVVAGDGSLSAPVSRSDETWWLPADAFAFFDLWVHDDVVEGGDGLAVGLAFPPPASFAGRDGELVDLGRGVPGLRLYAAGRGGAASQSLLLADAGLLGLAMPGERRRFDDLVERAGRDHALIMVLTSLTEEEWESVIEFSQGASEVEARHPFRLRLVSGEAATVGPESPAVGVVLLPESFNLREPITVRWGSASGTITFRR